MSQPSGSPTDRTIDKGHSVHPSAPLPPLPANCSATMGSPDNHRAVLTLPLTSPHLSHGQSRSTQLLLTGYSRWCTADTAQVATAIGRTSDSHSGIETVPLERVLADRDKALSLCDSRALSLDNTPCRRISGIPQVLKTLYRALQTKMLLSTPKLSRSCYRIQVGFAL